MKNVMMAALAMSGLMVAVGCGGAVEEAPVGYDQPENTGSVTDDGSPPSQTPEQVGSNDGNVSAMAYCSGYNGNNYCLAECNDGISYWYVVGHVSAIPYGNCQSAAFDFCRSLGYSGYNGACWGYP